MSLEVIESDGILVDIVLLDVSLDDQQPLDTVKKGEVGPDSGSKVDRGVFGCKGDSRVDDDHLGRVRARHSVEHSRPEDGLRSGDVMAEQEQAVRDVYVIVGAWKIGGS